MTSCPWCGQKYNVREEIGDAGQGIKLAQLAVETSYWPLYEVEDGIWKLTYKPDSKRPVTDWLKPQGRFSHLFREENQSVLAASQQEVDKRWEELLARYAAAI